MKIERLRILLLTILIIINLTLMSQPIAEAWGKCFGGSEWDEGTGLIQVGDFYYFVGMVISDDGDISSNHGAGDIWFVKTDLQGNMISERTFGGSNGEGGPLIKNINDNEFYIVGNAFSVDGDVSYNPYVMPVSPSIWVLKINDSGEIIWDRIFGGHCDEQLQSICLTKDNSIVALSNSCSSDGDISTPYGNWDFWLIKVSEDGEKLWEKSYGNASGETAGAVIETSDNGFLITGSSGGQEGGNYDTSCNHHNPSSGLEDIWVIKTDSVGEIQWQQCYGGYHDEAGLELLEIKDGYIILGATMSNDGDVSGYHGTPGDWDTGTDIWVVKIDFDGNIIWQKCLGSEYWDFAFNIFTTSDSGFMVVGSIGDDGGDVAGFNGIHFGEDDVWFAKLNSIGELEWQYCYGGLGREYFLRGIIQKSDLNYVLTLGTTTDDWQCYNSGAMPNIRLAEIDDTMTSIIENKFSEVNIYPNPATNTLIIEKQNHNKPYNIEIYNSTGTKVFTTNTATKITSIDVSEWISGVYVVKVASGSSCVSKKIVVR